MCYEMSVKTEIVFPNSIQDIQQTMPLKMNIHKKQMLLKVNPLPKKVVIKLQRNLVRHNSYTLHTK